MPSVTAGRLCPKGIFIRPDMARYREESRRVMEIVARRGAGIEQVSVDEAYLDLSAFCQGRDADESLRLALPVAREIKEAIRAERKLTASIGIAECPPDGDLTTLLIHADLAMYEAKQAGGGGWRIFGDAGRAEPASTGIAEPSPEATGTHQH